MRICGVIAEYNPFHNGHRHQLAEARRLSGCDYIVCVMGGAFSQRGEVMLLDKWTRARMALLIGADAVVELPCLWAVRSADAFARGGVNLLAGLGADCFSFGCETDDEALLVRLLEETAREDDSLRIAIREGLEEGKSLVRARGEAISRKLGIDESLIAQPNTVLALEYLRANRALARPMRPIIVRRLGGYHDSTLSPMAGASAIRQALLESGPGAVRGMMPDSAFGLLHAAWPGRTADMSRLDALLVDRLRADGVPQSLPDISEGLDRRLARCAETCGSREALLAALKCKRYTHARLSRLCAHALLGLSADRIARHPAPEYARLLGFRQSARPLLAALNGSSLPLVTRPSALRGEEVFELERRATDLQTLCFADESARAAGQDFSQRMVVV